MGDAVLNIVNPLHAELLTMEINSRLEILDLRGLQLRLGSLFQEDKEKKQLDLMDTPVLSYEQKKKEETLPRL